MKKIIFFSVFSFLIWYGYDAKFSSSNSNMCDLFMFETLAFCELNTEYYIAKSYTCYNAIDCVYPNKFQFVTGEEIRCERDNNGSNICQPVHCYSL